MNKKGNTSNIFDIISKTIIRDEENIFLSAITLVDDINETDSAGETLLWKAVSYGRDYYVIKLLGVGANPDIPSKDGFYPFHLAIQHEDISIVQILLNFGTNIFSIDSYGNNALGRVLSCHGTKAFHLIVFLLEAGLDPNMPNFYGNSAMDTALRIANYDFKSLFLGKQQRCNFDSLAITSYDVLNGERVKIIRYYELDKVWEFQSDWFPSGQDVKVVPLETVINENPLLVSVMNKMNINQEAIFFNNEWTIFNMKNF